VNKKVVFAALKPLPVADLNQRSQARMSADESFRAVRQWNDSRRKRKDQEKKPVVLHPASFKTLAVETQQRWQTLHKALERKTDVFTVENTGYDKELMRIDTYSKEINEVQTGKIATDIYIAETYQILKDLISLQKK
jgi:hypothetical protein